MGLDIGFYDGDDLVFHMRNHWDFLSFFDERTGGPVDDVYLDFYVTGETLDKVSRMLDLEIEELGIDESRILTELPPEFMDLDGDTRPWEQLLCFYPAVVTLLRDAIEERGPLVCGWSA